MAENHWPHPDIDAGEQVQAPQLQHHIPNVTWLGSAHDKFQSAPLFRGADCAEVCPRDPAGARRTIGKSSHEIARKRARRSGTLHFPRSLRRSRSSPHDRCSPRSSSSARGADRSRYSPSSSQWMRIPAAAILLPHRGRDPLRLLWLRVSGKCAARSLHHKIPMAAARAGTTTCRHRWCDGARRCSSSHSPSAAWQTDGINELGWRDGSAWLPRHAARWPTMAISPLALVPIAEKTAGHPPRPAALQKARRPAPLSGQRTAASSGGACQVANMRSATASSIPRDPLLGNSRPHSSRSDVSESAGHCPWVRAAGYAPTQ